MAEIFCRALFQTSNIVPSSDSQDRDCIICLQETGKLNPETGLVELQVRLPCAHVVGSGCIAVWLSTNNSCPLCRRVFFPAHQEEYPEDMNMQDQEEDSQEAESEGSDLSWVDREEEAETENMLLTNCRTFSLRLELDNTTIRVAQTIAKLGWRIYPFCDLIDTTCDENAIGLIGLAIYIASSFAGSPRSPREICEVSDVDDESIGDRYGVNGDRIREFYRMIYLQRGRLINDDFIIETFEGHDREWPSLDPNDDSDDHIENSRDLSFVRALCNHQCDTRQAPPLMLDLAQHIGANVVRAGFHAFRHPEGSEHLYYSEIAGVSLYIASHLLGQPISRRSLQDTLGIGNLYPDVRSTCIMVRRNCDPLVEDDFCETLGIQVSWESLEANIGEESPDGRHGDRDEADVTRTQATSPYTRTQWLEDLCEIYCERQRTVFEPTTILAQRLSERFGSLTTFEGRRPESIAAACVYIAYSCTAWHGRRADLIEIYPTLVALTGVNMASMYTTHLMMAQEIMLGRVHVQDIAESLDVEPRHFRNILPPAQFGY